MAYDKAATSAQLQAWLEGRPYHDDVNDQCCPDFSCCHPQLLAPEETRRAFAAADNETRMAMLGMFLGAAISATNPDAVVVVIDGTEGEEHVQ